MAAKLRFDGRYLSLANPKVVKGQSKGYLTFIQHFAPATLSGREVCPARSTGCTAACLNSAGRGGITARGATTNAVQLARLRRTLAYFNEPAQYFEDVAREIERAVEYAARKGFTPCIRLNGTSDVAWEAFRPTGQSFMERFPRLQFYDYTKIAARLGATPKNYDLTFSASEDNVAICQELLATKRARVAVVFTELPRRWWGATVIDGDTTDLRFLEKRGLVVGLTFKQLTDPKRAGRTRAARRSGFVQNRPQTELFDPMDSMTVAQVIFDPVGEVVYV